MPGIDDIMEMILKEARSRKGQDLLFHIYRVMRELGCKVLEVIDTHRANQRRMKDNENKK